MNFKQMNPLGKAKQSIGVFGGLNQSSVGADNEFLDMKNISSRLFPSLTLREPNLPFTESEEPVQIFYKNSSKKSIKKDRGIRQGSSRNGRIYLHFP